MDIALFPIDTLKTRIQSERGFIRSGGFKGLYRGLAPAAAGSAPAGKNCSCINFLAFYTILIFFFFQAAAFFCSYEFFKNSLSNYATPDHAGVHMVSASLAEFVCILLTVYLIIIYVSFLCIIVY